MDQDIKDLIASGKRYAETGSSKKSFLRSIALSTNALAMMFAHIIELDEQFEQDDESYDNDEDDWKKPF